MRVENLIKISNTPHKPHKLMNNCEEKVKHNFEKNCHKMGKTCERVFFRYSYKFLNQNNIFCVCIVCILTLLGCHGMISYNVNVVLQKVFNFIFHTKRDSRGRSE